MATKIFPTVNDVGGTGNGKNLNEANLAKWGALASPAPDYVQSGGLLPGSSANLTISVPAVTAHISGYRVEIDTATNVTVGASVTTYIFLKLTRDGSNNVTTASFTTNTTGTNPGDAVLIGTAVSSATAITSTSDRRNLGPFDNGTYGGHRHTNVAGDGPAIDHTSLLSKGSNTHAQIDTKLDYLNKQQAMTLTATAGWYRIAQSPVGEDRTEAWFDIEWTMSGYHGRVGLSVGQVYGASPFVNQHYFENFGVGLTQARIVYSSTTTGNTAYLEVYLGTAVALPIVTQMNTNWSAGGWTLVTTPTAGSIPGGFYARTITFAPGFVTSEDMTAGGQLKSTVADGTPPMVVTSTTKVANLNVERVDDYHVGNASGQIPVSNGTKNVNLNAEQVDGFDASQTPGVNQIPVLDASGKNAFWSFASDKPQFRDSVTGLAPHGGFQIIAPSSLPASSWFGQWQKTVDTLNYFDGIYYYAVENNATVTIPFVGTGLIMRTFGASVVSAVRVSVDGGATTDKTYASNGIASARVGVTLCSGLTYGPHTVTISDPKTYSGSVGFDCFEVIGPSSGGVYYDAGVAMVGGTAKAIPAGNLAVTNPTAGNKGRCDLLVAKNDGTTQLVAGTDGQSERVAMFDTSGKLLQKYRKLRDREIHEDIVQVWRTGTWSPTQTIEAVGGKALDPTTLNATTYIGFTGTDLYMKVKVGTNRGYIKVAVDGGTVLTIDTYKASAVGWEWQWVPIVTGLAWGYHELAFTWDQTKNASSSGNFVTVADFEVWSLKPPAVPANATPLAYVIVPPAVTTATLGAKATAVQLSGWRRYPTYWYTAFNVSSGTNRWSLQNYAGNTGNSYTSWSAGADGTSIGDASTTFFGTGVRVIGNTANGYGKAKIYIDGSLVTTIDCYSASPVYQAVMYENTGLSLGVHSIKIQADGTKNASSTGYNLNIDSIDVYNPFYALDARDTPIMADDVAIGAPMDVRLPFSTVGEGLRYLLNAMGPIQSSGINANGSWWRFANGMQVCCGSVNVAVSGVVQTTPQFPASFANANGKVVLQPNGASVGGSGFISIWSITNYGSSFNFAMTCYTAQTVGVDWIAVGVWKAW